MKNVIAAVLLALTAYSLAAVAAGQPEPAEAGAVPAEAKEILPPAGWTSETRRVQVALPHGEEARDIEYFTNSIGMEFVKIPAGEFMMGSPPDEAERIPNEGPQHRVRIAKPFYMSACETTNGQYRQFLTESGYDGSRDGYEGYLKHFHDRSDVSDEADYPVVWVSWKNARKFCEWLSLKEGATYRLPTEAEWEYACRAGTTTRFYSGDSKEDLERVGWYHDNSDAATHPVGLKPPNGFGLYDMHGNVFEWCQSLYKPYPYDPDDGREDLKNIDARVLRDGAWRHPPKFCRSAIRTWRSPLHTYHCYGFRVVVASPGSGD